MGNGEALVCFTEIRACGSGADGRFMAEKIGRLTKKVSGKTTKSPVFMV